MRSGVTTVHLMSSTTVRLQRRGNDQKRRMQKRVLNLRLAKAGLQRAAQNLTGGMVLLTLIHTPTTLQQVAKLYTAYLVDCAFRSLVVQVLLLELLKEAAESNEKMLVFSQSLVVLELIEQILNKSGRWTLGVAACIAQRMLSAICRSITSGLMAPQRLKLDKAGWRGLMMHTIRGLACS